MKVSKWSTKRSYGNKYHYVYIQTRHTTREESYIFKYGLRYKPLKKEKHSVRLTIGGDKLEYVFDTAASAESLIETKLLVNSVVSDSHKNSRFLTLNIKDFYLQTIIHEKQYMKIHSKYISDTFRNVYKLHDKIHQDGYVYC